MLTQHSGRPIPTAPHAHLMPEQKRPASTKAISPLALFSDELLLAVFRTLSLPESLNLARVCRRWRQLVWTHLRTHLEARFLSNPHLNNITFEETDDLFHLLRLRHRELMPLVASCLRNVTSVQYIRTYLQQQKATSRFLRMTVGSNSLPVCRDAIVSLSMLCCHGELSSKQTVWQAIMEDPNARNLIQHIHSPESEIEMHMLGIIGNIASDLQLQNQLVKWDAIPPILRVLKKGFDLSSEHAVRVVLNFCEGERETKEILIMNGAVSALMRHFGSDEYELDIWRCLYRLAEGAVSSEGVVSAVFQAELLRNGILEYLRLSTNDWAFELRSMLDVHPSLVEIARYEDVNELIQHIENASDPIVSSQSSMILCGITSIEKYRPRFCKDRLIPTLTCLLTTPEFILLENTDSVPASSSTSSLRNPGGGGDGDEYPNQGVDGLDDDQVEEETDNENLDSQAESQSLGQTPEPFGSTPQGNQNEAPANTGSNTTSVVEGEQAEDNPASGENAGDNPTADPTTYTLSQSSSQTQLTDYPGFQIKENIALALANFSEDEHLAEICSVPGFLHLLISLLGSRSVYVQEAACQLISTVVQYGNISNKFRQGGGIEFLAGLFQQTKNERVLALIMKTMTNLSLDFNDRNVEAMHKASMLSHLFDFISSGNYELIHNLTECLWCLSISDETRIFLREHPSFPNVLKLLDSKEFEIRCNVSGMLGNLMTMDSITFWKGQNVMDILYRHLRDFAQMVCEHVLQMLAGLCHDSHYDPGTHRDYLEDILELFEQGDEEVSEHAAGTLTPLTCYSDICSADLAELGFLSSMVNLLKVERVRTFLPLAVLYNVIKSTHEATAFVHLRGLNYLSKLLCTTQDHDVTWVTTACFSMIIEVHGNFVKTILSQNQEFHNQLRKWLDETDNPLHQSCASWLLMFFALDQPNSDLLTSVRKSATSLLRCIIQEEHAEHVLRVMARLCTLDSQYLNIIQKAGAMQAFMKAIDYEEGSFQSQNINTAILWALTNMLEDNSEGVDSFIQLGGLSCALRFLKKGSSDWAKVPAAAIVTICFSNHHSNGTMSQSANIEELALVLGDILQSTKDSALKCYAASALAAVLQYSASTVAPTFTTPIATTFTHSKRFENLLTGECGLLFLLGLIRSKSGHLRRIAIQSLGTLAAANRICLKAIKEDNVINIVFQSLQTSTYYDMLWTCLDTLTVFAGCDAEFHRQICDNFTFPFKEGVWGNTRLQEKVTRLQGYLSMRQAAANSLLNSAPGFGINSLNKSNPLKEPASSPGLPLSIKAGDRPQRQMQGLRAIDPKSHPSGLSPSHNRPVSKRPAQGRRKITGLNSTDFDDIGQGEDKSQNHTPVKHTPTRPVGAKPLSSTPLNARARKLTYDVSPMRSSFDSSGTRVRRPILDDHRHGNSSNTNQTSRTGRAAIQPVHDIPGSENTPSHQTSRLPHTSHNHHNRAQSHSGNNSNTGHFLPRTSSRSRGSPTLPPLRPDGMTSRSRVQTGSGNQQSSTSGSHTNHAFFSDSNVVPGSAASYASSIQRLPALEGEWSYSEADHTDFVWTASTDSQVPVLPNAAQSANSFLPSAFANPLPNGSSKHGQPHPQTSTSFPPPAHNHSRPTMAPRGHHSGQGAGHNHGTSLPYAGRTSSPARRIQTRAQLRAQQRMHDVAMCYLGRPSLFD